MKTDLKKQLIGTVVWSAIMGVGLGVMLGQRDKEQSEPPRVDQEGFEAWEGAEDPHQAQEAGGEPGEEAASEAADVAAAPAKRDGPHGTVGGPASDLASAEGRGVSGVEGAGEFAGGTIADLQGGAAVERGGEELAAERKAGTLSREALQESIETLRPIARQCYLDALKDFPDVDGRVMLEFEIISEGGEGRVAMTEIGEDSTLYESSIHTCLQHHISEVVFDSPGEDAVMKVTYPFHFAQGEEM